LSSKQIATELSISPFTVETHRKNLLAKTETSSTGQLIAKAIREGWV
jgi:DNA-binding CsgD family transcriptional regulator